MNRELKDLIDADMGRVYDHKLSLGELIFFPLEMKYLKVWRKAGYYYHKKPKSILSYFWNIRLWNLTKKTQITIPSEVECGKGLYIGHLGRIIIHPDVKLGENVNIATGVTIGQTNRGKRKGVPQIGNKVWIGTNAVIVGNITIGDDVMIAPNSFVNCDVPAHSIVVGNPAVISHRDNATDGYINKIR